jgi:hypothetical protein
MRMKSSSVRKESLFPERPRAGRVLGSVRAADTPTWSGDEMISMKWHQSLLACASKDEKVRTVYKKLCEHLLPPCNRTEIDMGNSITSVVMEEGYSHLVSVSWWEDKIHLLVCDTSSHADIKSKSKLHSFDNVQEFLDYMVRTLAK